MKKTCPLCDSIAHDISKCPELSRARKAIKPRKAKRQLRIDELNQPTEGKDRLVVELDQPGICSFRLQNLTTNTSREVTYWSGKRGIISEITKGKLQCQGSKKITIQYGTGQEPLKETTPGPVRIGKPSEKWDDRCPRIPIICVIETDVSGEETVIFIDPESATATFGNIWIRNFKAS